ncbi:MAG: hypothetical protein K5989_11925 [Lachnospiraceae bacterium]|nr:hypothetical protein [Lachnospiraceae bacterium]
MTIKEKVLKTVKADLPVLIEYGEKGNTLLRVRSLLAGYHNGGIAI